MSKTITCATYRNYFFEIVRQGNTISPVSPDEVIMADDKLIFNGNVKNVDALSHIKGLVFAEYWFNALRIDRSGHFKPFFSHWFNPETLWV